MSTTFATSLDRVEAMPWHRMLAWYAEAQDIYAETWGLLRGRRDED